MESVIAFVVGLAVGLLLFALLLPATNKRQRARHQAAVDQYEQELAELRQERADDRETNRRLRRELAINTPDSLQNTREERDRALDELEKLNTELHHTTSELADRDRSLREARLAIHDIRVQLERDRFNLGQDDDAEGSGSGIDAVEEANAVVGVTGSALDSAGSAFDSAVSALDDVVASIDEVADTEPEPPAAPEAFDTRPEPAVGRPATLVPPSILNAAGEVGPLDDELEQPAPYGETSYGPGDGHDPLAPALSESAVGGAGGDRHDGGPRSGASVFFDDYPLGDTTAS